MHGQPAMIVYTPLYTSIAINLQKLSELSYKSQADSFSWIYFQTHETQG